MTPHLEDNALWPTFRQGLVTCLYRALVPLLSERYYARIAQRCYTAEDHPSTVLASSQTSEEEFIEVWERHDGLLIALIDVVSPANKTSESGRHALQATRDRARELGASIVEIDLLRQGRPRTDDPGQGMPDWDYVVTVTRSTRPECLEVYAATFPLPRFRMPLASDDADITVDVSNAVAHGFDRDSALLGPYRIHSAASVGEPQGPLPEPLVLTHEAIAVAAYFLWEHEGHPHGRDKEHWYRAIEQLQRAVLERAV